MKVRLIRLTNATDCVDGSNSGAIETSVTSSRTRPTRGARMRVCRDPGTRGTGLFNGFEASTGADE